tara:strand:- start:1596 stop:1811 length:216 start_codon:yes stop_codon:yes gene_type:complete
MGGCCLVSTVAGHNQPVLEPGTVSAAMLGFFICDKLSAAMVDCDQQQLSQNGLDFAGTRVAVVCTAHSNVV